MNFKRLAMMPLSHAQLVNVESAGQSLLAKGLNGRNVLFVDHPMVLDPCHSSLRVDLEKSLPSNEIGMIVLASMDTAEMNRTRRALFRASTELFPNAIFVVPQKIDAELALRTKIHVVPSGTEIIDLLGEAVLLGQLDGRLQAVILTTRGAMFFGCRDENDCLLRLDLGTPHPLVSEGIWIFYSQGRSLISQAEEDKKSRSLKINNEEQALRWVNDPWKVDGTALETETISAHAARGIGRFKKSQQDSFRLIRDVSPLGVIAGVADGHGILGHVFSEMALEFLMNELNIYGEKITESEIHDQLENAISAVEKSVHKLHIFHPDFMKDQYDKSGTTLLVAVETPQGFVIAHVGDSRAYLLSSGTGEISPLTKDHKNQGGRLIRTLGDFAAKSALKQNPQVTAEPDIFFVSLNKGDSLLLVSDGLQILSDQQICSMMLGRSPEEAVEVMMRAVQPSARDNVAAVILKKK